MDQLGDIDQLENLLRVGVAARRAGRGRHRPGPRAARRRAARVLEQLAELAKMLEEAGLIEQKEGRFELTPRGMRRIGQNALSDLFSKLAKDRLGRHEVDAVGRRPRAGLRDQALRVRRPVQPQHRAHRAQRDAAQPAAARRCGSRPTTSRSSAPRRSPARRTVLMLDLSLSMPMRDNFLAAKKVAMALHSLISTQFPRDFLGIVGLQRDRPRAQGRAAARGVVGLRLRHQHAARLPAQPPHAGPADRHQADHHDHRRRAHRPPHPRRSRAVLQLPAGAGDGRRHPAGGRCAARARTSASTPSCSTPPATSRRSSRSSPR